MLLLTLAGRPFKILGNANHQDFAAVGVAVPDHLQWYRVQAQKNWGSNGWRTAHNPPTPALLDAMDELGYVSWDENHRNGQLDQVACQLVLRLLLASDQEYHIFIFLSSGDGPSFRSYQDYRTICQRF